MKSVFRIFCFILTATALMACNKTVSTGDPLDSQSQQIASSSGLVTVRSSNPSSGDADLDFVAGRALAMGSNSTRVRLIKEIPPYSYELIVYYDNITLQATHVSLSWIYNKSVLNNAFSSSPAGVFIDTARNRVIFSNTLLNSGLPSTANLNGQFNYLN